MPILKTLDEVFGKTPQSQYPAKTEDEYRKYLSGLTKIEIQLECNKQHVAPRDSRSLMTTELVSAFRRHNASIAASKVKPTVLKDSEAVKNIFRY